MPDMIDYADDCDYNSLKSRITNVLLQYFEYHDNGNRSKSYNPIMSAQEALDEIHDIIGDI